MFDIMLAYVTILARERQDSNNLIHSDSVVECLVGIARTFCCWDSVTGVVKAGNWKQMRSVGHLPSFSIVAWYSDDLCFRRHPFTYVMLSVQTGIYGPINYPVPTNLYRTAWNASDENSVCPSIKRVDCDKTEEKSVQIFIPCDR